MLAFPTDLTGIVPCFYPKISPKTQLFNNDVKAKWPCPDSRIAKASGTAESEATVNMMGKPLRKKRMTVGVEKAYKTKEFAEQASYMNVTSHVAQNNIADRVQLTAD